MDPSKYRPISMLNTKEKVLEKLLIQRIMNHAYKKETENENQYGFTPQKNTVDAAMEVRQYNELHLNRGGVAIIISLDKPAILQRLREIKCPKKLYYLVHDYLKGRKAVMTTNKLSVDNPITRGCPQGRCSGPGLWIIQYDSFQTPIQTEYARYSVRR